MSRANKSFPAAARPRKSLVYDQLGVGQHAREPALIVADVRGQRRIRLTGLVKENPLRAPDTKHRSLDLKAMPL